MSSDDFVLKGIRYAAATDEQLFRGVQQKLHVKKTIPAEGVAVPATGWKQANQSYEYRPPFRKAGPLLRKRTQTNEYLCVRSLLSIVHVAMRDHRELNTNREKIGSLYDADIFRLLAFDVLLHTQSVFLDSPLIEIEKKFFKKYEEARRLKSEVFGEHAKPGHNVHESWRTYLPLREDETLWAPLCAAYNANVAALSEVPSRVCLDEIVIKHTQCMLASRKGDCRGPEFLLLSGNAPVAGVYYHVWIKARDWNAQKGPRMDELVKEAVESVWLDGIPVSQRPLLVADSRFLSPSATKWLTDEVRGPFVASLNTKWHKGSVAAFARKESAKVGGGVTLWRGSEGCLMIFEDNEASPPARQDVNFASSSKASRTSKSHSARPLASLHRQFEEIQENSALGKRKRTVKRDDDYVSDFEESEEFGDVEEVEGNADIFNPKDAFLTLEKYRGVNTRIRRKAIYLLSNAIMEFERPHRRREKVEHPLFTTFSGIWQQCDRVNKLFKQARMLYRDPDRRYCSAHMQRYDFVFTSALHFAHVLVATKRGENAIDQYKWSDHGLFCSKLLEKIALGLKANEKSKVYIF